MKKIITTKSFHIRDEVLIWRLFDNYHVTFVKSSILLLYKDGGAIIRGGAIFEGNTVSII